MTNGNDKVNYHIIEFGDGTAQERGLTKREYFAAMAMQGLITSDLLIHNDDGSVRNATSHTPKETAWLAVDRADALIAALNKPQMEGMNG